MPYCHPVYPRCGNVYFDRRIQLGIFAEELGRNGLVDNTWLVASAGDLVTPSLYREVVYGLTSLLPDPA